MLGVYDCLCGGGGLLVWTALEMAAGWVVTRIKNYKGERSC